MRIFALGVYINGAEFCKVRISLGFAPHGSHCSGSYDSMRSDIRFFFCGQLKHVWVGVHGD